ncbi:MAG: DUF938 domain-containing protein [Xenococcaceae cyanobacterium MO_188.B29]|nr:DUF938 domain-containing protein [Xenococcaceae cyanobacterium MO_188.B29]
MSPLEKPPLDPHPLSPYVAWAGALNRNSILELFKERLPKNPGEVLELASGSGMHINYFANHFQQLNFQPSDQNEEVFENIRQLNQKAEAKNVYPPIKLDLTQPSTWSSVAGKKFDAIFCINIFQVAPISIADGMMKCAASLLRNGGSLFIYGPFKVDGKYTTTSNEEFDKKLISYGVPEWGLKDIADITLSAQKYRLNLKEKIDMPSNNFTLLYEQPQR